MTCEIKLQIHRPGIEKTLPAGPREAGSSPAGRWQGPGEAPGRPRCRGRAAGRSRPAVHGGPGRGLCPEPAWPCSRRGDRGEALGHSEKVLQGEGGEGQGAGRDAAAVGGCPEQPAGTSRRREGRRQMMGFGPCWEAFWKMFSARDASAPPVVTPVPGRRGRLGTRFPGFWGGGSAPRPRRGPQLAAGAASPPLTPAAPAWLCHRSENGTLPEARSFYKEFPRCNGCIYFF